MLRTRNNTDGNKLVIFSGIALYYGDTYILTHGGKGQVVVDCGRAELRVLYPWRNVYMYIYTPLYPCFCGNRWVLRTYIQALVVYGIPVYCGLSITYSMYFQETQGSQLNTVAMLRHSGHIPKR